MNCRLSCLLAWIFHSDEQSMRTKALYFFHCHLSLYSKMVFQLSVLPLGSREALPTGAAIPAVSVPVWRGTSFPLSFLFFYVSSKKRLSSWSPEVVR